MRHPKDHPAILPAACPDCGTPEEIRACVDCGRMAHVIDCGHYPQPAHIAGSKHAGGEPVCVYCEDTRDTVAAERKASR